MSIYIYNTVNISSTISITIDRHIFFIFNSCIVLYLTSNVCNLLYLFSIFLVSDAIFSFIVPSYFALFDTLMNKYTPFRYTLCPSYDVRQNKIVLPPFVITCSFPASYSRFISPNSRSRLLSTWLSFFNDMIFAFPGHLNAHLKLSFSSIYPLLPRMFI